MDYIITNRLLLILCKLDWQQLKTDYVTFSVSVNFKYFCSSEKLSAIEKLLMSRNA